MSEAAAEDTGREIWIEKYRPQSLDSVVGHDDITARLRRYIADEDLPHLLFAGPAGTGKCVTGETPVLTNRGVERIESVVGDGEGFAAPDSDLEVATLDDASGFEFVEPLTVFSKRSDGFVRVSTRDGNESTVTPEHRLLVIDGDGLSWTPAERLQPGDRIVRPLDAPLPEGDPRIEWLEQLDGDRVFAHVTDEFAARHEIPTSQDHVGAKREVLERIRTDQTDEEIAEATGICEKTIQMYRRRAAEMDLEAVSTVCPLSYLRSLDVPRGELREHVERIQYVSRYNHRSRPVEAPRELTTELGTLLGLTLSEARVEGSRIKFYNTDETLLKAFSEAARQMFGVDPKRGQQRGVPYLDITNRTVVHYLRRCFAVLDDSTAAGSRIVRAPPESRRAFLRAVFDAEGHVTAEGMLELTQKDEDIITLLSYLLAGEGIPTRRKTEQKAATNGTGEMREFHILYVSGASALSRFEERVGFSVRTKAERLAANAARDSNPNHDTIPVQSAVSRLCESLYLPKGDLLTGTLNPESPGRDNYLDDVEAVLDAATDAVEIAQECLETVQRLRSKLDRIEALPSTWIGRRGRLEPIPVRRDLSSETGIRPDRLLEYSDGRRTPERQRATALLETIDGLEPPDVDGVQADLRTAIQRLGVPYNHVAHGTELRGTDVINLLENDDHSLSTVTRFRTVADRVRDIATGMCSQAVLKDLRALDVLARRDLYFDEVTSVEGIDDSRRVYDLTVPETRNYIAGRVPTVMHNTTSAVAIAREIYGEEWREHFLELNASDERGIDVVRDRIKSFARAAFGGTDHRIIFLDEADALTDDAQSALRRTMEQFSDNTRFVLSCNYSSQIIDPIQSRCTVFRFSPLGEDAVAEQVRVIADAEDIELTDEGVDALVYAADGDMRKAINGLQAAAVMDGAVDEETVYTITSTARPEEIREMVTAAMAGDFTGARAQLDTLLSDVGIAGGDVIDQLHRSVWEFDLDDREAVRLMERIGEADYRITAGANEQVQLEALLASLALDEEPRGRTE